MGHPDYLSPANADRMKTRMVSRLAVHETLPSQHAVRGAARSMREYYGIGETFLYFSLQQPPSVHSVRMESMGATVRTKHGVQKLDSSAFLSLAELSEADLIESFAPAVVSTRKQTAAQTLSHMQKTLAAAVERFGSRLVVTVPDGMTPETRDDFVRSAIPHAAGFFLGELPHATVDAVIKMIPADRIRVAACSGTPSEVVRLIARGIDLVVTDFPAVLSREGKALVFAQSVPVDDAMPLSIDLHDSAFASDMARLCEGCACAACATHTRAYIHHLLCAHELLAHTLLQLHNLHHYAQFFRFLGEILERSVFSL